MDKIKVDKRTAYYDMVINGLGLRVSQTGTKTFFYRHHANGKQYRHTLGHYPTMSLADARAEVLGMQSKIRKGEFPVEEEPSDDITFKELHEIYKKILLPTMREKSQDFHNWVVNSKILPVFGDQPIDEITKKDVVRMLDKIAIENETPTTANRTRARLHHIFEFAVDRGYIETNVVSSTKPYKGGETQRERYYDELETKAIWEVIEKQNEPVRSYLKIITLTGQRRTETLNMRWQDIERLKENDFEGWVWRIPPEKSKSKREHIVPLSLFAHEVIENLRQDYCEFVFASRFKDGVTIGLKTVKRAVKNIKEETGINFRLHDMRRTVATHMAKNGVSAEVLSRVLNHKSGGGGNVITRIYNRHSYLPEKKEALNLWGKKLQEIIEA